MSNVETTSSSTPRPVRKRSTREKVLVWGGILVLLGLVSTEWIASSACNATLEDLNVVLRKQKELPLAELKQHIRGWATVSDEKEGLRHGVTVTWPSLFRQHKLRLGVQGADQIYFVEEYGLEEKSTRASAPIALREKTRGLPLGYENVVALHTNELTPLQDLSSGLVRELVRQSFLIAAQDELRLPTLDASIEAIPAEESPRSFPFTLKLSAEGQRDPQKKFDIPVEQKALLEITQPTLDGVPFRSIDLTLTIYRENRIERLAKSLATMSGGPFVDVLKKAGYQKSLEKTEAGPAAKIKDQLDLVSQFAILREVHSQIRANGESPVLVGRLVRAYANLGNLTDLHWNNASKAFKARALIYAERLVAKHGETPFNLAHRAYALALTGRHATALQAARAAKDAKGQAASDWLPVIVAYCEFQSPQLQQISGPHEELAQYLRLRLNDTTVDSEREQCLEQIQHCLELNPACFRAGEMMSEIKALGPQRNLTEQVYFEMWPPVYARLIDVPQLPSGVSKLIEMGTDAGIEKPRLEFTIREKLFDELKKAGTTNRSPGVPSWSVLEWLLREASFLQAFHSMHVQATMLGIPGEQTLVRLKPIVNGHPYASVLDTFAGDHRKSNDNLTKFIQELGPTAGDIPFVPLVEIVVRRDPTASQKLVKAITWHRDEIYEDATFGLAFGISYARLMGISPNCPRFIASTIQPENFEQNAQMWEAQYADSQAVLNQLAYHYARSHRPEDAIRCYKKAIAISPSYSAYEKLAEVYKSQGDLDNWQDSLERALELPSFGLEASRVQMEIAEALMRKGEWEKAEPFAEGAAGAGSGWGLKTAARCAEGLGNWQSAESLTRAMSVRYEAADWYFWCARTGRGDIEQAKIAAAAYWVSLSEPLDFTQTRQLAARQILDGKTVEARETFANAGRRDDVLAATFAAILADEAGEKELRNSLLADAEKKAGIDECHVEFVNQINGTLSGEERGRWNPIDFERMVISTRENDVPYLYYFAGRFLGNHGQQELADEYMQSAATVFDVDRLACALANHALREANKPINPTRLNNVPDSIAPIDRALRKARIAMNNPNQSPDIAEKLFDQAVQLREDFVPSRLQRGLFREEHRNYQGALADYEEAVRLDPRSFAGHANLAWLLATCEVDSIRNGARAMEHAKLAAARCFYKSRQSLEVLAAAHAELGEYEEAVKVLKGADRLHDYRMHNHGQRSQYAAGKPYHHAPKDAAKK